MAISGVQGISSCLRWGGICAGVSVVTAVALKAIYDIKLDNCVQKYHELEFCSLDSGVTVALFGLFTTATFLACVLPTRRSRRVVVNQTIDV